MPKSVFLCTLTRDYVVPAFVPAIIHATKNLKMRFVARFGGILTQNQNQLWCQVLNGERPDYFAMLHCDVVPDPFWLDVLEEKLSTGNLDVLSMVIPIKDDSGATSTAILMEDKKVWRLPSKEVHRLPEVFTAEDIEKVFGVKGKLLINTGCWLAKIGPWCEEFPGFDNQSFIVKEGDQWFASGFPDDWAFSLWLQEKGLRIAATHCVKVKHFGITPWTLETEGQKRGV